MSSISNKPSTKPASSWNLFQGTVKTGETSKEGIELPGLGKVTRDDSFGNFTLRKIYNSIKYALGHALLAGDRFFRYSNENSPEDFDNPLARKGVTSLGTSEEPLRKIVSWMYPKTTGAQTTGAETTGAQTPQRTKAETPASVKKPSTTQASKQEDQIYFTHDESMKHKSIADSTHFMKDGEKNQICDNDSFFRKIFPGHYTEGFRGFHPRQSIEIHTKTPADTDGTFLNRYKDLLAKYAALKEPSEQDKTTYLPELQAAYLGMSPYARERI